MAPAVPVKMNRRAAVVKDRKAVVPQGSGNPEPGGSSSASAEIAAALVKLAAAQAKALSSSKWVGNDFAERSRAIHYGEAEVERIHGQASLEEAVALREEGIGVVPLLVPVVPPEEAN